MSDTRLVPLLQHIRRLSSASETEDQPDAALLQRLASGQSADALERLVRRHGPLVWRVCLRVLRREVDAEDAFQATFLALARRPASIRKPASLSCWLHSTAYRIARRARQQAERLHGAGTDASAARSADPFDVAVGRELGRIVEEEVHALPERLRAALLLCYWEGLTNEETARRLGCPCGTVKTRLARARQMLHDRLARRGVTLPVGVIALLLAPGTGESAVPPSAASATIRATGRADVSPRVAALAEAGLRQGAVRMKLALLLLTVGALAAGMGALAHTGRIAEPPDAANQPAKANPPPAHVDAFGDPLPDQAVTRLGTVRFRMGGLVYACCYSPDGKTLAAGSDDHHVYLFDPSTGKLIRRLSGTQFNITSLAYAPDGRTLAAGSADNTICIWDVEKGEALRSLRTPAGPVWSLAFARDGKLLISAGHDKAIRFWDPTTGKELRQLTGHQWGVRCAVLSPDGRTLASAADKAIRLWNVATGETIRRLTGPKGPIRSLAFSPDGKLLASGNGDSSIWLWDASTGEVRRRLADKPKKGQTRGLGTVYAVAFSHGGKVLASGGADHTLRLWDVTAGEKLHEVLGFGRVTYTGYHEGGIPCLAFSPDDKWLALGQDNRLALLDVRSGAEVLPLEVHRGAVQRVFFSPDGSRLITTSDDPVRRLLEWGTKSGRLLRRIPAPAMWARLTAFSPDRKILAGTSSGLQLWDTTTGAEIRAIPLPIQTSTSPGDLLYSPDGKYLAVAGPQGEAVWLVDPASGKRIGDVEGMGSPAHVARLAFSPDGRLLAAASRTMIDLAEIPSGRQLRRIVLPKERTANTVALSPDGRMLAAPCSAVFDEAQLRLWEAATGRERLVLAAPRPQINCVTFSPDGRLLAAGGWDQRIYLWDTITGEQVCRLEGHRGHIESLAFSPDGRRLASGSLDTTALIWDVPRRSTPRRDHPLTDRELEALWSSLSGADAARAYQSILTLASAPELAVPLLTERLARKPEVDAGRIARLLARLDGEDFTDRERATDELRKLGWIAEPALQKLLEGKPSPEARKRAQELLSGIRTGEPTPDLLRLLRGIEVLERIGTAPANRLLETVAAGRPHDRPTREAQASLERLTRRPIVKP
jgi:RNA polymerase sigma factor (sigma-70 family)